MFLGSERRMIVVLECPVAACHHLLKTCVRVDMDVCVWMCEEEQENDDDLSDEKVFCQSSRRSRRVIALSLVISIGTERDEKGKIKR